MPEYVWMCLYNQYSEYASGPKYAKLLSMSGGGGSQYAKVTQRSEYT